jgi:hypothetical protein
MQVNRRPEHADTQRFSPPSPGMKRLLTARATALHAPTARHDDTRNRWVCHTSVATFLAIGATAPANN